MKFGEFLLFYKKYIMPFLAILILIMLIFIGYLLSNEQELKEKISENCGWEGEDYRCFCEKGEAIRIQNILNGSVNFSDVELVW